MSQRSGGQGDISGERSEAPSGFGLAPQVAADLLQRAQTRDVRFINLEFTDAVGLAKCVTIPADQLEATLAHGRWFDGSSIEGLTRVAETDMYLRPDPTTYAEVPWRTTLRADEAASQGRVARLICDVLAPNGERFGGEPRAVLGAALAEAEALGYRYEVSPELEFFLLRETESGVREPLPNDCGGYFDLSTDLAADVRREVVAELQRMGIGVESSHHEVAAGQHEIDFTPADALRAADNVVTARYAIKAIAQRHGLSATFMPKPFYGVSGSGMHTHQRLTRLRDGANAFANAFADPADAQYGLSAEGRHFIAGQLDHAPALCAIIAPLVNSYKRLTPGFEAPVMISWGRVNREALIRAPRVEPNATDEIRIELRAPDPSCNPYLAFAAMLRAGLDGMTHQLPLPAPVEEGLRTLDEAARLRWGIGLLPATLGEALAALQADATMLDALGEQIAAWFMEAKTLEWAEYRRQVHQWELDRYLPSF
ncbi:MAG: type I glutamate--ammonia ligase [Ktedonobacterales bacterium]